MSLVKKGRVSGEGSQDPLNRLREKLHPSQIRLSGKMRALVDFVLGERFTNPWIGSLSVTSDGFVVVVPESADGLLHDEFLGTASDLYRNYVGVLTTIEADAHETRVFLNRYNKVVSDFNREDHIERYFVDLFKRHLRAAGKRARARKTPRPSQIELLRRKTVDRGCTAAEAESAQIIANELEQKNKNRRGGGGGG